MRQIRDSNSKRKVQTMSVHSNSGASNPLVAGAGDPVSNSAPDRQVMDSSEYLKSFAAVVSSRERIKLGRLSELEREKIDDDYIRGQALERSSKYVYEKHESCYGKSLLVRACVKTSLSLGCLAPSAYGLATTAASSAAGVFSALGAAVGGVVCLVQGCYAVAEYADDRATHEQDLRERDQNKAAKAEAEKAVNQAVSAREAQVARFEEAERDYQTVKSGGEPPERLVKAYEAHRKAIAESLARGDPEPVAIRPSACYVTYAR